MERSWSRGITGEAFHLFPFLYHSTLRLLICGWAVWIMDCLELASGLHLLLSPFLGTACLSYILFFALLFSQTAQCSQSASGF